MQVIDPAGPGAGSSGGVVGALAPHVPENWNPKKAFQLAALLEGEDFWRGVDAASGLSSGYGRTGRLQPLADDRAVTLARRRAGTAATLWQGRASWEIVDHGPGWAPPAATGLYVRDSLTARLYPARAVASLAGAVTALGGRIATTGTDTGAILWATGHRGLDEFSRKFSAPLGSGVKGQAALLGHDAGDAAPQLFAASLHFIPHDDGTLAIGSTSERDWSVPGPDGQLDTLLDRARDICPALAGAPVLQRWAGIRPRAITRAPLLGAWPGRPGHFIANGGFKIGFGLVPRVAAVMAALMLDGTDAIPADFSPATAIARARG